MTAAVADITLDPRRVTRMMLPLATGQTVYKGTIAYGDTATANVKQGAATTTGVFLGVFNQDLVNTSGSNQPVEVNFVKEKTLLYFANDGTITTANLFSNAYMLDNQTVTATASGHSVAGMILDVDPVRGVGIVAP